MKRIQIQKLKPGDIILTASNTKMGKTIRRSTRGIVSHAMICVQHGSVIDSTATGVQAWNLQREFFEDDEAVFAFRLTDKLPTHKTARVVDFARSEVGTRYSKKEAARSVIGGSKPRSKREFCSRLVARAYRHIGIQLVSDQDYCTPEDLRISPLLTEICDITEPVSAEEIAFWQSRPNPIQMTQDAQNSVLNAARAFDSNIENFQDLDGLVRNRLECDNAIADALQRSGYLELWKHDFEVNPWHYDLDAMEAMQASQNAGELRAYCVDTVKEAYSGGIRYAVNLAHYQASNQAYPRKTLSLFVELYERLVKNDRQRCEVARNWLLKYYPDDVKLHMEWIEPHSEMWFLIVDQVESTLGFLARNAIQSERSGLVCSSCGDTPTNDYRIANSADAMPGVPSLRLCDDCCAIRVGFGEVLEKMD